jgi:dUTP pyrophosphatase
MSVVQFCKKRPDAVLPTRAGPLEAGFDLTVLEFEKNVAVNSYLFDTGIALSPPAGYFAAVVPRSSLVKLGVMLTNSVGIIDPTYTGSIKVVLSEIHAGAMDSLRYQLPLKLCQLVFLPLLTDVQVMEVAFLEATSRNSGGFGSTDLHSTDLHK